MVLFLLSRGEMPASRKVGEASLIAKKDSWESNSGSQAKDPSCPMLRIPALFSTASLHFQDELVFYISPCLRLPCAFTQLSFPSPFSAHPLSLLFLVLGTLFSPLTGLCFSKSSDLG